MRPRWDRSRGVPEPVHLLDRIKELECGEPLVALSEFAPSSLIMRPQTIPYVRQRVAVMVEAAASRLPDGLRLGITDAWRPLGRQVRIYAWMTACVREAFPDRAEASVRRTVNRWVAPPSRKAPPGHCTGAAVDVVLVDRQGEILDVSTPFDRFQGAPTYVFGLTEEAQALRTVLVEAMLEVGFSNCRDEWWHYSFGDAGWAVRTGQHTCCYGAIGLPEDLYSEQEKLAEQALRERPNPFLSV